jgi:methionyl-tRNA formyltransferase
MQMEAGLDTGPVLARATCPIHATDTATTLHDRLAELGSITLLNTLDNIETLQETAEAQDDDLTCYAEKLHKQEAVIDWSQSASQLSRQIHAFNPWPVAQTEWQGEVFKIWDAEAVTSDSNAKPGEITAVSKSSISVATGNGTLIIRQVQIPGKRAMSVSDFLNANALHVGDHFG